VSEEVKAEVDKKKKKKSAVWTQPTKCAIDFLVFQRLQVSE
jgi:hypothetical protein